MQLLVGPQDTPYAGGFYLFNGMFPDEYPFYPMKMTSLTQGGGIRKHPNLYTNGKCCFSFLGTWAGPAWTACQNPVTVAISMVSVLTNNPIQNEPGWESKNDKNTKLYELAVRYFNIRYAVLEIMLNKKELYKGFVTIFNKVFLKNYKNYLVEINKFKEYSGKNIKIPIYNFQVLFDYEFCQTQLKNIYDDLTHSRVKNIGVNPVLNKITQVYTRKCPKDVASKFPKNTIKEGLDKRMYYVKEYANLSKRWVLHKNTL
tara:strand:+ start:35 stop:808 length:774 start_codon:yes stop_codon:yes gene_type:complete